MRVTGACALLSGGAMYLGRFLGDPGGSPAGVADPGLLNQQAALVAAGGTLCLMGTVLLVGAALADRLDRLREPAGGVALPRPEPSRPLASPPDEDEDEGYSGGVWADTGRQTWKARGAG